MNKILNIDTYKNLVIKHKEWIIYFFAGCILTYPFLIKVHLGGDAYSLLSSSYEGYATVFMRSARVITAMSYHLFSWIHLPYTVLAVASVFVANIFMALACVQFHRLVLTYKTIKRSDSIIFMLSIIFSFYNFFTMEYFGFMEAYAMCLGIYFVTLSMKFFLYGSKKGYLFSLVFVVLAAFCYQSLLSIYIALLAFLVYIKNDTIENKKKIMVFLKEGVTAFLFYGISYVLSFIIMKLYTAWTGLVSGKDGAIDIFSNLKNLDDLILDTGRELFRYFEPKYFYSVVIALFALNIIKAVYNRNLQSIIWLLLICFLCVFTAFIPNIFLPGSANYVAPRMLPSIPMVVGILCLFYLCAFQKDNGYIRDCAVALILCFTVINSLNYNWTLRNANGSYYQDRRHVEAIYDRIRQYESDTGEQITTIYYTKDDYVPYFYSEVEVRNSYTYRMYAYEWITGAAINGFWEGRKFEFVPMEEQDKERLFESPINYEEINDDEFVFEGNSLYLLLY